LTDEACPHKHLNVPRDGLKRDVEWSGELGDEERARIEALQNRATHGIREGEERPVEELFGRIGGVVQKARCGVCLGHRPMIIKQLVDSQ
jgi:hypothetical protein